MRQERAGSHCNRCRSYHDNCVGPGVPKLQAGVYFTMNMVQLELRVESFTPELWKSTRGEVEWWRMISSLLSSNAREGGREGAFTAPWGWIPRLLGIQEKVLWRTLVNMPAPRVIMTDCDSTVGVSAHISPGDLSLRVMITWYSVVLGPRLRG